MTLTWESVDPLGEALHLLRMSGAIYCRSEFSAPWGVQLPAMKDCLIFHVLTSGRCWLEVEGEAAQQLHPGDLVVLPRGQGHRLVSELGAAAPDLFDLDREHVTERYEVMRHGGGGSATQMVCGAVRFDHPAARHLIQLLPPVIKVDPWTSPQSDWIQSTLRFMSAEAMELRPGGEAVITRLADILVVQAIRSWIETDPAAQTGWLGALKDRRIGRAISLIHRHPSRGWTVASLAAEASMSRSAFAARFTEFVGEPALQYVTRWRMHVAVNLLRESDAGLTDVASRLGYDSEAAFSRAFKRIIGVSPGAARRPAAAVRGWPRASVGLETPSWPIAPTVNDSGAARRRPTKV